MLYVGVYNFKTSFLVHFVWSNWCDDWDACFVWICVVLQCLEQLLLESPTTARSYWSWAINTESYKKNRPYVYILSAILVKHTAKKQRWASVTVMM